jgi:hypothetical protein
VRFAMRLSRDVVAINVTFNEGDNAQLLEDWGEFVEKPARAAGVAPPKLVTLHSPYRHLVKLILRHLAELEREHPNRTITVVVPELVGTHWLQFLLHNQTSTLLKAALLLQGDDRVVIVNVPWYLKRPTRRERRAARSAAG